MTDYANLDGIDAAKGGVFRFRLRGQTFTVQPPQDVPWRTLLEVLYAERVPGSPPMSFHHSAVLFRRWSAHYDLPTLSEAQRLAYNVDRYRRTLEHDLRKHHGLSLDELWRARRWRELLNAIDYLPSHSHYAEAVANDPEHAKMLLEALERRAQEAPEGSEDAPAGPSLHAWTDEVRVMTDVLDAVRDVQYTLVAVNHNGKGPAPKPPARSPRPKTVMERVRKQAQFDKRLAKHKALTARMLPHKAKEPD